MPISRVKCQAFNIAMISRNDATLLIFTNLVQCLSPPTSMPLYLRINYSNNKNSINRSKCETGFLVLTGSGAAGTDVNAEEELAA